MDEDDDYSKYFKEDEPKPKPVKKCQVCGVSELDKSVRQCSRCLAVSYCCLDHQKSDWEVHKTNCKQALPFITEDNEEELSTKYCVATRDLEKGTIIMEEEPIFYYSPTSQVTLHGQCVTCGINITDSNDPKKRDKYRCSLCGWPVCSVACEKAEIHAKNECRVFQENNGEYPEDIETRNGEEGKCLGEFVMIARAFSIRCQNPKLWEQIIDIMPIYTLDEFNGLTNLLMNVMMHGRTLTPIKSCFPKFLQEEDKNVRDEILAVITVLGRRIGFPISTEDSRDMSVTRMYMYNKASYLTHACAANCTWYIGPFPDFKIRIRAAVSIKKGDRLTVNRQGHVYYGTRNRQLFFQERFKRYCHCKQCSDASELRTFQSGIACSLCRQKAIEKGYENDPLKWGYLLPTEHLNERRAKEDVAEWKCYTCGDCQPAKIFLDRLDQILKTIRVAERSSSKSLIKKTVDKIFKEHVGSFLHPNHYVVQHAIKALQEHSGFPLCDKEEVEKKGYDKIKQEFEEGIQRFEFLLKILDKTCPGLQLERVKILLLLGDGLLSLCKICCEPKTFFEKSKEEALLLEQRLMKAADYLEDALMYWKGTFIPRGETKLPHVDHLENRIDMAKNLMQLVQALVAEFHNEEE